jgi:hypothetical protein
MDYSIFNRGEQKVVEVSRERFERESARLREQMAKRKVERLKEMKINWQRIALELRKHMALEKASHKLGRHKDWLNRIARGEIKEPAFSDGLKLLDLAYDRIGADRLRELT